MKIKSSAPSIRLTILTLISVLFLYQNSVSAQKDVQEVLSANQEVTRAIIIPDSVLYFSILSADFMLIDGNTGNEMTRDQFWDWWKNINTNSLKAVGEVTSITVNGSTAWLTYHYTFTPDNENVYKEIINDVDNYENYSWIGTGIFKKENKKWKCVLWHTSRVPKD